MNTAQPRLFSRTRWVRTLGALCALAGLAISAQAAEIRMSRVEPHANGTYGQGDQLYFLVSMTGGINVTGSPGLNFRVGGPSGATRTATFYQKYDATTLIFVYTVTTPDFSIGLFSPSTPFATSAGNTITAINPADTIAPPFQMAPVAAVDRLETTAALVVFNTLGLACDLPAQPISAPIGGAPVTVFIRREPQIDTPVNLLINLTQSGTGSLTLSAPQITIPATQDQTTFTATGITPGTVAVRLHPSAAGASTLADLVVNFNVALDPSATQLTWTPISPVTNQYAESDSGSVLVQISVPRPVTVPTTFTITGYLPNRLEGDATVTIPTGANAATFSMQPLDGSVNVALTISNPDYVNLVHIVPVINIAPTIVSPPALPANPTTAATRNGVVGSAMAFSATATDPAGVRDPLTYRWDFPDGSTQFGATAAFTFVNPGPSAVTLTVSDGDNGSTSISIPVDIEIGNLLNLTVAPTGYQGLAGVGTGSIAIVNPATAVLPNGNRFPTAVTGVGLLATPGVLAVGYDSYIGFWAGDDGSFNPATSTTITKATANTVIIMTQDRGILHVFSRERYRNDNFGDIDGDGLSDVWESMWTDDAGAPVLDPLSPAGQNGAGGNPDGDFLPATTYVTIPWTSDIGLGSQTYQVRVFNYPISAVQRLATGYVPQPTVSFSNIMEFRGVGEYLNVDDDGSPATATVNMRPASDGDEPNTDPSKVDTDEDGMPDGWEYYFWAVAFYGVGELNPGLTSWRAFDGTFATWDTTYGTPITAAAIMAMYDPAVPGNSGADLDNDGLDNLEELALGTNPIHWDTDGDGMPDGWEVDRGLLPLDHRGGNTFGPGDNPDADHMASGGGFVHNDVYMTFGFHPRTGWNTGTIYPNTIRYSNFQEFYVARYFVQNRGLVAAVTPANWMDWTTNPLSSDTDGDGMADGWELYTGLDPLAGADAGGDLAYDDDGLTNLNEFQSEGVLAVGFLNIANWPNKLWPTDPWNADTDNDQMSDGRLEQPVNYNPTSCDTDGDWLPDYWEYYYGTDGLVIDTYADYDGDKLQNYQEYLIGAVYHFHYYKWFTGGGYGDYEMWDFFDPAMYGRQPYGWDPYFFSDIRYQTPPMYPFFFLSAEGRAIRVNEPRGGTALNTVLYATGDPFNIDTDNDGMDDYYEMFHGLNPLYGGAMMDPTRNIVGIFPPPPESPWDLKIYPWLVGCPFGDIDSDGLATREEALDPYQADNFYHTDPTPLWITDTSYDRSFVNLYYMPGPTITFNNLWWWGWPDGAPSAPCYAFDFECNEGYDTDNDNIADRSELTDDEVRGISDTLNADSPRRRKAMRFDGTTAAARTRNQFYHGPTEMSSFSVEAWVRPITPAAGRYQTLVERSCWVPQDNAGGATAGKRLNFRLSLTPTGTLLGEFQNFEGARFSLETTVTGPGLQPQVWSHVAMTYSGTTTVGGQLKLLIDGTVVSSAPSSLIACNGWLPSATVATTNLTTYTGFSFPAPIVVGAADDAPYGVVSGALLFYNGSISSPAAQPQLTRFFEGWVDEVRIWDGARTDTQVAADMRTRYTREMVASTQLARSAWLVSPQGVRPPLLLYHYTFDNLPDTVVAADRDPAALVFPSDTDPFPAGFDLVTTRPNDGSYNAITWWGTANDRTTVYDASLTYAPWIENTVDHMPCTPPADAPRFTAIVTNGSVIAYREVNDINGATGATIAANRFPNTTNPYGVNYRTAISSLNELSPDFFGGDVMLPGIVPVVAGDLLPLRGAVADIDVDMWDGYGPGYDLASQDSDGDQLPDYWELMYGLDPYSAVGLNGSWGDPDGDGLDNLGEYLAGMSPIARDSDGDGYSDYDDRDSASSLTYGEAYDDKDGMPSLWETQNDLDPRRYNAEEDPDGDGWTNIQEYMAGSDPQDSNSYPLPFVKFNFLYNGMTNSGALMVYSYSERGSAARMDGPPDAIMPASGRGNVVVVGERLGATGDGRTLYSGTLRSRGITPGTVRIFVPLGTYIDNGQGVLIGPDGVGTINYANGNWTITFNQAPAAGVALRANYTFVEPAGGILTFPFSSIVQQTTPGTKMNSGKTWFFGFIDVNNNALYDTDEPAGLALYQPVEVGWGDVEVTIPLTDYLTGFPRFSWPAQPGVETYYVTIRNENGSGAPYDITELQIRAPRNFVTEQDLLSVGGLHMGSANVGDFEWFVCTAPEAPTFAQGNFVQNVAQGARKVVAIRSPTGGSTDNKSAFELRWTMDYRAEGAWIQVKDSAQKVWINRACYLPVRYGALTGDYYYGIYPQFVDGAFVELPDGVYTVTVTELLKSDFSGVTRTSASTSFTLNRSAQTGTTHSISGSLAYYGKVPPVSQDIQLGSFDGVQTTLSGTLPQAPHPGSVTFRVIHNGNTIHRASDVGAAAGAEWHGLLSESGTVSANSAIHYRAPYDYTVQLTTPPPAGSVLVVSYKHYGSPILIQAFRQIDAGALGSFNGVPAAQVTVYEKGAYTLNGLPPGNYSVLAFFDQNGNGILENWETRGFLASTDLGAAGQSHPKSVALPPSVINQTIVLRDRDTDNDGLPDAWEKYHFGSLTAFAGMDQREPGLYLWQEYADGELDSDPNQVDSDHDGLPDNLEVLVTFTNTHVDDTDGDGLKDREEFLSGSNPCDRDETVPYGTPAPTFDDNGNPVIEWTHPRLVEGTRLTFTLKHKADLAATAWTTVGTTVVEAPKGSGASGIPAGTCQLKQNGDPDGAGFYKLDVNISHTITLAPSSR